MEPPNEQTEETEQTEKSTDNSKSNLDDDQELTQDGSRDESRDGKELRERKVWRHGEHELRREPEDSGDEDNEQSEEPSPHSVRRDNPRPKHQPNQNRQSIRKRVNFRPKLRAKPHFEHRSDGLEPLQKPPAKRKPVLKPRQHDKRPLQEPTEEPLAKPVHPGKYSHLVRNKKTRPEPHPGKMPCDEPAEKKRQPCSKGKGHRGQQRECEKKETDDWYKRQQERDEEEEEEETPDLEEGESDYEDFNYYYY